MNVNDSVTKVTSIHLSYYLLNNILSDKTMSLILPGTKALSFLEVFSIFSVKNTHFSRNVAFERLFFDKPDVMIVMSSFFFVILLQTKFDNLYCCRESILDRYDDVYLYIYMFFWETIKASRSCFICSPV